MDELITQNPNKIKAILYKALETIIENRIRDGAYTDEEDVKDTRHYFSTLEGLECLLIPFVVLPKNHFWEPLRHKFPKLKSLVIDDINFVLDFNRGRYQPPQDQGQPYFIAGGSRKKQVPFWTSECSSFTLSTLTNFLEFKRKFGITQGSKRDALQAITTNYEWVRLCKRNSRGWSWVNEATEHPWPTWSLLDTFEELTWYPSTKNLFPDLEKECEIVVNDIVSRFKEDGGEYLTQWKTRVTNQTPYDANTALDLTRLMLAASLYKQHRDVFPLAEILFTWASQTDFSQTDYQYHLRERKNYISDSSLVPSVFRALITVLDALKHRRIEALDDHLEHNHEVVLNKVFRELTQSQIKGGPYDGLWGIRSNGGITYELYFTERTIESLTSFLSRYKSSEPVATRKARNRTVVAKRETAVKRKKERSEIPNDIDKYTVWIPKLARREVPEALQEFDDWPVEDLLEFYLFRLFNVTLALDGAEWGYKERFKELPDGRLIIPDNGRQCLYDAKSSKSAYKIDADEVRKFKKYAEEGKRKAAAIQKEVQVFLVIGNSFSGDLTKRATEFQAEANLKLVCMQANDICNFANLIRQKTTNPSELKLVKWSVLLSGGNPLIEPHVYEEIRESWHKDLENLV